jgi:hypothetical protein
MLIVGLLCGGGPATLDTFDAVTAIVRWSNKASRLTA